MQKKYADATCFFTLAYLLFLTTFDTCFHVSRDPSQIVRPHIPFEACLDSFMREEVIEQFFSSAVNKKVTAHKYVEVFYLEENICSWLEGLICGS